MAFVGAGAAGDTLARSRHRGEDEAKGKAHEPAPPAGPLFFVISTNKQHVSVYGRNGLHEVSPVSTGRPDHPTPHGIFSIIGKERFHRSNLYAGAPMPFMQRITWSGVAMHEGVLPGYPASHGCVRLPHDFARRLFGYTDGNERVIIARQDIAPAPISNPRLFEPKLMPAPGQGVASSAGQMLQNAIAMTESARQIGNARKLDVAVKPGEQDGVQTAPEQKLLNPIEFAKAMKARAVKQAEDATAALSPARSAIDAKARAAAEASVAVRKAEIALANAKEVFEAADRRVKRAAADEDAAKAAGEAKVQAEARLPEAEAVLAAAQRVKAEKDQLAPTNQEREAMEAKAKEAQEAALAARKAENALLNAKDLLEAADRRAKRTASDIDAAKAAADAKAQAAAKVAEAEAAFAAAQQVKAEKDREVPSSQERNVVDTKAREAREAAFAVRRAEIALSDARDTLELAGRRLKRAAGDAEAAKAAADVKARTEAKVSEAEAALAAAKGVKTGKDQEASQARDAVEARAKAAQEAAVGLRKAELALSNAKDLLEAADRRVKRASADADAAKAAAEAKAQEEAKVAEAEAALNAAKDVKAAKDQDAAQARNAVEAKAKEVQDAASAVRKAEAALAGARDALEAADRRVKRAASDVEASKGAAEAKAQAEPKVAEAEAALAATRRVKAEKDFDAASAQRAYKDADSARRAAADAAKAWERRLSPLSVFVSRKTQRLYIRQGHIRVFDVPVTIREPEKPLGTHVFMAMPGQNAEASLRWLALTIPDASTDIGDESRRSRRRRSQEETPAPPQAGASASEALDRIEVAPEVREKISEMLWAGSSLIVSDKPMSGETGEYTDFVILTR